MFFPSVHLILVCKSKCPKIMDTYQGEWGHCDNRYCFKSLALSLLLLGVLMDWPTQLFPLYIGCFNFLPLFVSQPTINLFSKLELGPWNQSVEEPIMYK